MPKDVMSKLVLWLDTDKVEINDPLYERIPIKLDMSHQGIKNYNVRLRKANMKEENIEWLNATAGYNGYLVLNLDSQDTVYLGNGDNFRLLGTFKVSILAQLTLKDKVNSAGLQMRSPAPELNALPVKDGIVNKKFFKHPAAIYSVPSVKPEPEAMEEKDRV
jgi:hypothetical protein